MNEGTEYSPEEILQKVVRYREYFGEEGGITVSGGEPLLQAQFVYELFCLCHSNGINTCLDTSGCIMNDEIRKLLTVTDRVLLDIKYTDNSNYQKYVGCTLDKPIEFLSYLDKNNIPVTLRQVIIPSVNDDTDNITKLSEIRKNHTCIDNVELLPFRKICQVKYDSMNINFPFGNIPEPTKEVMGKLNKIISS